MTLLEMVDRERRRLRGLELAAGGAAVIAILCGGVALAVVALGGARWLALPRVVPLIIWALLGVAVAGAAWHARRRLRSRCSLSAVAATIEREQALRSGALRGAVEVAHIAPFGTHAANTLASALQPRARALAPAHHAIIRRRALRTGSAAVLTLVLLAVVAPVWSDGLLAVLRPVRAWNGSLLAPVRFDRLPPTVLRGDTLQLMIVAPGRRTVQLRSRVVGEGWESRTLAVRSRDGVFTVALGPVRGDVRLVASDGRSSTDTAAVHVVDRPFLGAITLRAEYPAYLDRASETLPVGQQVVVPRGTTIQIAGRASIPLVAAGLVNGRDTVRLRAANIAITGHLVPVAAGSWNWFARGADAAVQDLPDPVDVSVVPDSAPQVEIVAPQADTLVAALDTISLQAAASDDHGLASVELRGWRGSPADARGGATQVLAVRPGPAWTGATRIDLAALHLAPGDAFHVSVRAVDNSPWAQQGVSRELVFRIPTTDERRQLARDAADSAVHAVQRAATAEQGLQQRTAEMSRERINQAEMRDSAGGQARPMSFESAEKARALATEQQQLADRVNKLQASADQLRQQLARAGALDSTLARQLRDAQQMLRDALTPQLMAEMQKLQGSARQLDAAQTDQSLANLAAMQKLLREQLEKSAQMLQRAAFEGAMQTLHDEAADISKAESALGDSAGASRRPAAADSAGRPTPTATSQQLADRSAALATAIKALQDKLSSAGAAAGARRTDDAHTFASASTQSMKQRGDASTASSEMQRAAQAMQQARDQQVAEWKDQLTTVLDRAVQELLQMSRQEQRIEQQLRTGAATADAVRGDQGAVQQGVDQTQRELQQQAQRSALVSARAQRAMADAQEKVAAATKSASDPRNARETPATLGDAAEALNRAAAALARDRQGVNSAGSASGFAEMLQQLQQAARQQGAINSQAQALLPMPGQGAMSAEAQAAARMLAAQERRLAQQMEDLGDTPGGDRATQLAREARAVAQALEQGRVDAATVARQEQLLQHMLDAGRSLQKDEREDSGKREAEAATNPKLFTPQPGAVSGRGAVKFREPSWDELRGLSADERRAVLDYFRRINGGGLR